MNEQQQHEALVWWRATVASRRNTHPCGEKELPILLAGIARLRHVESKALKPTKGGDQGPPKDA